MRDVPIRDNVEGWNCVSWVAEVLQLLNADGKALGTRKLGWVNVRNAAMTYVQQKKEEHRFDGKGSFDQSKVATYNLLEQKEIIL